MLHEEDLIPGNYYYIETVKGGKIVFKFKELNDRNIIVSYYLSTMDPSSCVIIKRENTKVRGHLCRDASEEEINWLHACLSNNKFIPEKDVVKTLLEKIVTEIKLEIGLK